MYKMTIEFKGHPSTLALESLAHALKKWVPYDADALAESESLNAINSDPPCGLYKYRLEYVEGVS